MNTAIRQIPLFIASTVITVLPDAAVAQQLLQVPALEEIVVTAQRREERLQEVPIAVSALGARELELRGINGISGLTTGEIPSLNVQHFADIPGTMQMSIRGVGITDATQVAFEQAVAVYADGVYLARSQGMGLDMLELERTEVLRGPPGHSPPWPMPSNDVSGHSLALAWDRSERAHFKSITAYRENDISHAGSTGYGVLSPGTTGFLNSNASREVMAQDQFSQEIQLFGSTARLEYTLGAMYFEEQADRYLVQHPGVQHRQASTDQRRRRRIDLASR